MSKNFHLKNLTPARLRTLIVLIAIVSITQNVCAEDAPEFSFGQEPSKHYFGLDAMMGNGALWTADLTPAVSTQVSTQNPLNLTYGYKFAPYFAVELGYAENDVQKSYGPGSVFFGQKIETINISIRQKTQLLPINTVWRYAVTPDVDAILKVGVIAMNNDFNFSIASNSSATQSNHNFVIKPNIGLASEVRINAFFSAIFGANYIPSYSYSYYDGGLPAQLTYQLKNSYLYVGTRLSF